MRVLIIGGGVVGVTSAWYLSQAGHEVTVIEKNGDVALETSAANAGQISPGYSAPLAAPGIPLKALKWMLQKHAPLAFRPDGTRFQLEWMWSMLRNCTPEHYQQNKGRMVRIAEYSRDSLKQLRAVTGIEYEGRQGGTLQLFRTVQQYESAEKDIKVLRAAGVPYRLLPAEQLPDMEPALATCLHRLTGGLHLPNDETGDCQLFTRHLTQMAEAAGVKFIYHQQADQIRHAEMAVTGVRCGAEWYTADRYVLAAGVWSRRLLDGLIDIPVYPLKGYSLTIPIIHSELAPVSTVLDESYKVAVTRFNDRIRVGGMAEIVGFNQQLPLTRRETLERVVKDLYPQGGDLTKASFWAGLRPMTPDGTPIVGPTPVRNLFLNTGHGTLGWTMACGSARLLSDLISGRTPDIAADDLSVMRYLPGFDAAGIRLKSHFG